MTPLLFENFVPLLKGRTYAPDYTLFSSYHLLDIFNQHLLISPVGIILLLSLFAAYKKRIEFKNPIIVFLIIVSIAQILYHFLVDPKFGAVRDWDLLSSVALGYTLLGVYLFVSSVQSKRYLTIILIFIACFSTLPWFLINSNTEKSIYRFDYLLNLDLKRSRTGLYLLYDYYAKENRFREANEVGKKMFEAFPEDSLNRAAKTYTNVGDYDKATELLKKAIEINPSFLDSYSNLGIIYLKQGKVDKAFDEFLRLIRLNPFNSAFHVNLGYALLGKERLDEALKEFKKAEKLGLKEPGAFCDIAHIYLRFGETEKAIKSYKKALKIDPGFYYAHSGLGQIYLDKYFLDEALVEFDQAVRSKPDYAPAHYNLGFVYSRKGLKEKALEEFELFLKYSSDETKKEEVKGWILKLRSQNP